MISDQTLFHYSFLSLFFIVPPTIISLRYLTAPYGKHHRPGWGPTISPPLAWFFMESPTLWLTLLLFPFGQNHHNPKAKILIIPFLFHYLHRTIIYPIKIYLKSSRRKITLDSPAGRKTARGFSARWVSDYADFTGDKWFWWRFAGGLAVFISAMAVNVRSDNILLGLKSEGCGYKIPRGGGFELVSWPNYFGEILEWLGWAFMTWSWASFGFFVYTCANLEPRARANHEWYLEKFGEDYPKNRKAVTPFVY